MVCHRQGGDRSPALSPPEAYFAVGPDGREREQWPDIAYVRVRPRWVRYSDFGQAPPRIEELTLG